MVEREGFENLCKGNFTASSNLALSAMNVFQFAFDYLLFRLSSFVAGQRHYPEWKVKNYAMRSVVLKNKQLAKDLEIACKKNGGILTYAEYLTIEQFGKNGYHARNEQFGQTGTYYQWSKALLELCKKNGFEHVVEFGSGDGALGIELAKKARKENLPLVWHGVEINTELQKITKEAFGENGLKTHFGQVVKTFAELNVSEPCLVVFSYSLDSIPPEIFINTKNYRGMPDTIIGISVKDCLLTEHTLSPKQLQQKGMTIKSGIVTAKSGDHYDLRSWHLYPWQRAYISLDAYSLFQQGVSQCKNRSMFVIIDEFRQSPLAFEINHLCVPKSLYTRRREPKDISTYYQQTTKHLLYYPSYFSTFNTFLHSVGFLSVHYDIEQKMAQNISESPWIPLRNKYFTFAFLVEKKQKNKTNTPINISYPARTIF